MTLDYEKLKMIVECRVCGRRLLESEIPDGRELCSPCYYSAPLPALDAARTPNREKEDG